MKQFYPVTYISGQEMFILVWYSNDQDGVFIDERGHIPVFRDISRSLAFMTPLGIELTIEESEPYDLDRLRAWLEDPHGQIDCSNVLNIWNLIDDIMRSYGLAQDYREEYDEADAIYDKLFWGCNLPSVTPEGEHYAPDWSETERSVMACVLGEGLRLFESKIAVVDES